MGDRDSQDQEEEASLGWLGGLNKNNRTQNLQTAFFLIEGI